MTNYARIFSCISFFQSFIPAKFDSLRRDSKKGFRDRKFFFFFWERVHVTSGENDRGRYPREGKGLVCAFAHAPRYRAER